MSNQLTPMQEAIEKLKEAQKSIMSSNKYADGYFGALDDSIGVLKSLLPKEQQVIEDVYWDGGQDIPLTDVKCKEYYKTKFKQNGK